FLKDQPVEARPPSAWYRLRKAARRNRAALTVAGVVAAAVLVGTAAVVWQAQRARDAELARLADQKRHDDEIARRKKEQEDAVLAERRQNALERATEAAFGGDLEKARIAIVDAQKVGVEADQGYWLNGLIQFQRGDLTAAIKDFKSSLALKPTVAAQAMLVRCNLHALAQSGGNVTGNEYAQAFLVLRSMEPVTPEDYMCRGFALR